MGSQKGYDYIIVGAGSAGCVLANRLSEDGGASVLILEAGPPDRHPYIHIPLGLGKMHEHGMFNWGYHTEPEPNMNGRKIEAMRGKVLGGSSSINVMAYTRGHRGDYDRWAQKGALGWSYADVLPYFKRTETWENGVNPWRGGSGPVGTEYAKTEDPVYDAWLDAARAAGLPVTDDYNGKQQEGFGRGQYTIRNGYRSSAATAYLKPARNRKNLTVETGAQATRLLMQGTRATGVEYIAAGGQTVRAEAGREVIVAGGTFNTPPLLMLSGIGPAGHLKDLGIKPVVDLPVGKNLQDHLAVIIFFARLNESVFRHDMRFDRMARSMLQAWFFGSGPGTRVPGGLHAFIKTRPELAVPDVEFMFRGAPAEPHLWFPLDQAGLSGRLRHPPDLAASGQPRRDPAALDRSQGSAAHRLQLLFGAGRSAEAARRVQDRAQRRRPEGDGALSRRRNLAGRQREDRRRDRRVHPPHRHHRASPVRHLRDGHRARGRHRSAVARARRRGLARRGRVGDARPGLGPHQCLRADDRREGVRRHSRQARAAGRNGCLTWFSRCRRKHA